MKEMYEVLKFLDHGNQCRQSTDCIQGVILLDYLREHPQIEKAGILKWFRQLATGVDQYHRCRKNRNYRYLNPCSVVVSEEGRLSLLDLQSPDNAFVMKQMQKRAVRNHFVKPVCEMGASGSCDTDLFAYGKTIQFILAYTEVYPPFTRREEHRLEKIISVCTGEKWKKYEDFRQILKDLPVISENCEGHRCVYWKRIVHITGAFAVIFILAGFLMTEQKSVKSADSTVREHKVSSEIPIPAPIRDEEEIISEAVETLNSCLEQKTDESARKVINYSENMELEALRCQAKAFGQLGMRGDSLRVLERLLQIEDDLLKLEKECIQKMELEAAGGDYNKAIETGEKIMKRGVDSDRIALLISEYRKKQ